ncbi:MAG: IclR family transcriptional regulator C-terminal domain-containing protein [Bacillus sp. (in: firmicutes)]
MGLESLIVERIDCQQNPIRIYDQLGLRIPLNIGAANKVMLAHMPQSETLKIVNALVAEDDRNDFLTGLMQTRKKGYGESHGERTKGTTSVAAPIFNQINELIGAISIGYVNLNITEERHNFLVESVLKYGIRISAKLRSK